LAALFREHWWPVVATLTRLLGDLELAEDAVQEACAAALAQWPAAGVPAHPRAWLLGTARHKAVDWIRREAMRPGKEAAAVREIPAEPPVPEPVPDDRLALAFLCCHPALDHRVRVPLTLRSVCGLSTAQVAAAFLVSEATMAQRLTRARRKIREARIAFRTPGPESFGARLAAVLRVVYVMYTAGHRAASGPDLVASPLCEEAVRLARALRVLLPGEPEVAGLLALLLLVDARRPGRLDGAGALVLLPDQDRSRWHRAGIEEGTGLLEAALAAGRPGPYQIQAAIAACHSTAESAAETDWAQIAALYRELLRYEPTPVVEANRAVAVAMVQGPRAGLAILDALAAQDRLAGWAPLHVARADLLRRLGRLAEAREAHLAGLALDPPAAERDFIRQRLAELAG
jgi:RNA polymerase sigma-70 factor, ECF subfamily